MTKKANAKIAIIGAGRLGTTLGFALARTGYIITAIADRNLLSAKETTLIIGQGTATENNLRAAAEADVLFLTTPDEALKICAVELSSSSIKWAGKIVLHCSGHHSSGILQPLKEKGASTASCHPIQSFADKKPSGHEFQGIYFGLEGDGPALDWAGETIIRLGGKAFTLKKEDKTLYHTACSLASNGLVALLHASVSTARIAGFDESEALTIMMPLIQKTLQNVKKIGIEKALTGPVKRGDLETVKDHLSALESFPDLQKTYRALAVQALDIEKREISSKENLLKSWKRLLEEK
jgi:predicted short-subunit dehydrogenase-like oxidoreductase (DUF2520 family)